MTARNAQAWANPPRVPPSHFVSGWVYRDPAIYDAEQAKIFRRVWRFAAHESEMPEAGAYRTFVHACEPMMVVRETGDRFAGFIDRAGPAGARLLPGPAGQCRSTRGLRPCRTAAKWGFVFVTLDPEAPDLDSYLGDALDIFRDVFEGREFSYEVFHFHQAIVEANWKAWQETILDLYHEFMHVVLRRTQMPATAMTARSLRQHRNGHVSIGGLRALYGNYQAYRVRSEGEALPGLTPDDARFTPLFPDTTIIARGTVLRVDTVTPLGPHRTLVESRGLGIKGESPADRRMRIRHHNDYWGPLGRNVPEDAYAAEACERAFGRGAALFQTIARDEDGRGQDDCGLRAFYAEWSRRLGRPACAPTNADAISRGEQEGKP